MREVDFSGFPVELEKTNLKDHVFSVFDARMLH